MENKNDSREERFDSYINKTIILSARTYLRKQLNIGNKERTIVDDEDYSVFLQNFIDLNHSFESVELKLQLNNALKSLSDIEQAVIFLLFNEDLTQEEAAQILEIYSKTVSKIKIRAIKKLRKFLKGDLEDEK